MKKFLALFLALSLSASLAACSAQTSVSEPASSSDSVVTSQTTPDEPTQSKVLNIWCWNDEFQSRFNDYYPDVESIASDKSTTTLTDGTIVQWTINPNAENNYQIKLDEALLAQDGKADDEKIDIFLIEADYALKYVDSPYTLDVRNDLGLTDADLSGQYAYTQDIASVDGVLKGTTW